MFFYFWSIFLARGFEIQAGRLVWLSCLQTRCSQLAGHTSTMSARRCAWDSLVEVWFELVWYGGVVGAACCSISIVGSSTSALCRRSDGRCRLLCTRTLIKPCLGTGAAPSQGEAQNVSWHDLFLDRRSLEYDHVSFAVIIYSATTTFLIVQ